MHTLVYLHIYMHVCLHMYTHVHMYLRVCYKLSVQLPCDSSPCTHKHNTSGEAIHVNTHIDIVVNICNSLHQSVLNNSHSDIRNTYRIKCTCLTAQVHICAHKYIPMRTCTYIHLRTCTYTPVCRCTYTPVRRCTYIPVSTCTYLYAHIHTCAHMYLCGTYRS